MKLWMKLAGCGVLAVTAVLCASAAIGGITGGVRASDEEGVVDWPLTMDDAEFVLKEYDGCVAVFAVGGHEPVTTTEIDVRTLREADRALLGAGLPAANRDEVLTLLEDLGS
ncbi:MAG TPA: hypothetical protein IAD33_08900 [Candidatus Scatomorpha gallistercoris]|nr:hypothetical protein [Candidatus Scatomorpha gallistercoris]